MTPNFVLKTRRTPRLYIGVLYALHDRSMSHIFAHNEYQVQAACAARVRPSLCILQNGSAHAGAFRPFTRSGTTALICSQTSPSERKRRCEHVEVGNREH